MGTKEGNIKKVEQIRPPIVVVMGHIDHGKTKLLDWYRKTKMVEQEAGGITQHIGAYEVEHKGKRVTFIDTPGHEAFFKLRSRGAKVADLAIIVVAADEGVKPQTREAIEIVRQNNLPFIVAINKVDKPEASPERVKQQLAEENVLVESYGGKVPSAEISAKFGKNMDELLDVLLLMADVEGFFSDPLRPAEGVVIEAHREPQRGITATLLIRDGTLKKENFLVIGKTREAIKIFEDFRGYSIEEAGPSSPALLAGLSELPAAGELFRSFAAKEEAETFVKSIPQLEASKESRTETFSEEKPIFNIVLKADAAGSLEALQDSLKKLESKAMGVNIIKSEVGDINESDVKMAQATGLVTIIGFKVRVDSAVLELAERSNIRVVTGEIIYEVLDKIKEKMEEFIPPEIRRLDLGIAKILKVFRRDGTKQIVGGRVEEGLIKKGALADIKRDKEIVGQGAILQLQQNKREVEEVEKGLEFGVMIDAKAAIEEGDVVEAYEEKVVKRTL